MPEVFLFANPIAGRGRGQTVARRVAARLRRDQIGVRSFFQAAQEIPDAQLAADATPLAAVVVGGDGTLRAAAERLLRFAGDDSSRLPPLLVVPLGTANLMVRHLGISWNDSTLEDEVAAAILGRRTVQLDAARANGRLFLLMAGVGLDATVVHELDRIRSGPIDLTSYALPALLALQRYEYPPLRVEVDGQVVVDSKPALAFIGNVREYGTGFPILVRAKSDDGLLDLCVLPCRTPAELLRVAMAVATGDHLHAEGVIYTQGRSIRVESALPVPVQIDGEASGHTPLEIELLPFRMPFIVPRHL